MTNEEKSLEISRLKSISELDKYENPFKREIYDRCIEMAEWKEKQLIDKACRWVSYNIDNYIDTQNDSEGYACEVFLERKFVDDFRKAMEE